MPRRNSTLTNNRLSLIQQTALPFGLSETRTEVGGISIAQHCINGAIAGKKFNTAQTVYRSPSDSALSFPALKVLGLTCYSGHMVFIMIRVCSISGATFGFVARLADDLRLSLTEIGLFLPLPESFHSICFTPERFLPSFCNASNSFRDFFCIRLVSVFCSVI